MSQYADPGPVGILILAAGESSRLGEPKQLLRYAGVSLLEHAVATALELHSGPVAVVIGAFAGKLRPLLEKHAVQIVENTAWSEGMGSSLRAGLAALLTAHPTLGAALVMLCDQPLITTQDLARLLAAHRSSPLPLVAAAYGETLGVPALFASSLFPELLASQGTEGARLVIRRHAREVASVPLPAAAIDIDTAAEFAALPAARPPTRSSDGV